MNMVHAHSHPAQIWKWQGLLRLCRVSWEGAQGGIRRGGEEPRPGGVERRGSCARGEGPVGRGSRAQRCREVGGRGPWSWWCGKEEKLG